jgi:hypothetical protein
MPKERLMSDDKREALAALEHDQWAHWTRYMLEVLRPVIDAGLSIPRTDEHLLAMGHARGRKMPPLWRAVEDALKRWHRQINTPYADLTEKEKNSDREWADKVLEITGTASPLDGDIIRVVQSIFSHAHFVVETPNEATLVRLMEERGNPIDLDGSVTDMEADYRRYLEDKEADWKEDLAQHEITQFLRYLQACGNHDAPFDLKAHLPRIQSLLDAHDKPGPT